MAAEPPPDEARVPTLGERLTGHGRALAARHLTAFPWAGPLAAVTERAAALDLAHAERFARLEVDAHDRRPRPGAARTQRAAGPVPDAFPGRIPRPERPLPDPHGSTPAGAPGPPGAVGAPQSRGRPLEPAVRHRLRAAVGPAADLVRVHDDPAADALARAHGADAVTVGTDVHLREGRYRPADERGFALLVHEAGHAEAATAPGAAHRRSTGPGRAAEERWVLARERAAATGVPGRDPVSAPPPPPPAAPPAALPAGPRPGRSVAPPATSAEATPMAAPVDRDVSAPSEPGAAPAELATLRRELVEQVLGDLRRRLRTEFERGG